MGTVVFVALIVVAILIFLAKRPISDKILQRLANAAAIVALVATALVFIVPAAVPPKTISQTLTPVIQLSAAPLVSEPANTVIPTPAPCVCQSATDDGALRCLIHTESEAANSDDLRLIQRIFAPDATIFRGDTREEWDSPTAYYSPTFAILDFTKARHFDIRQVVITARSARYTSGSSGYYAEPGATPTSYYNENPSEHWIFGTDDRGCWVITRFEFNASHIDF